MFYMKLESVVGDRSLRKYKGVKDLLVLADELSNFTFNTIVSKQITKFDSDDKSMYITTDDVFYTFTKVKLEENILTTLSI